MKAALVLLIGIACQYAQERPTAVHILQWGQRVVDAIHLKQGDTIIDVGAGKGVWLPVWSAAVGPTGRVIAEDIDKQSLDRARDSLRAETHQR